MKQKIKQIAQIAVLFLLNIFLVFALSHTRSERLTTFPAADAVTYKQGATGTVVTKMQEKLKRWGYYTGKTDGKWGAKTTAAVKYFQRKNKLKEDGVAGAKTLAALGMSTGTDAGGQSGDIELLARLISAESRGESYAGQVAVGGCVLNRVKHPSFPNTLSGVVYQKGAFSCLNDGQFWQPISEQSRRAARDALNGVDPSGGAIYYYNPKTATSQWIRSRPVIVKIGNHLFCR